METLSRNARILLMQNARQRYSDALNRRAPPEVVRHYRELYLQAFAHYVSAVIEQSSRG